MATLPCLHKVLTLESTLHNVYSVRENTSEGNSIARERKITRRTNTRVNLYPGITNTAADLITYTVRMLRRKRNAALRPIIVSHKVPTIYTTVYFVDQRGNV